MVDINKKLVKQNFTKGRSSKKIEYIVIHDTGNEQPLANAEAHFNYFNNANRNASAHYFVDEVQILQIIEDENTAWHCGDGKGKYGITNQNSLGIEICINDGDYNTEIKRTIELVKYLMKKHNVPFEKVVRHYDASRKLCPAKLSKNNWEPWRAFNIQLERELSIMDENTNKRLIKINLHGKELEVDGIFQEQTNYVPIRFLETLGYEIGWDKGLVIINYKEAK